MNREVIVSLIDNLKAGRPVELSADDFPCFSAESARKDPHVGPEALDALAKTLSTADVPTFERALAAIDGHELAWLGFKVVYDADAAVGNVDNRVTKAYGETGSADGLPLVFFCNDAKEIVSSRTPSARDIFQMKDATRGPSMHTDQFAGLTWASVPLFDQVRVWLLGASDVAVETAALAAHVDFQVKVVDYDPAFLSEARFPEAERILLDGEGFEGIFSLAANPQDYVCVLTRGHMFDAEGCIWGVRQGCRYIGMMGSVGKNDRIYELVNEAGVTDEQWDAIKRPIGLSFGAKMPAELAIAIVAELVDVRYRERYSEAARLKHERDLGRA